jgi:hypothetical protein
MQKYLGDVLLNTTFKGSNDITAYSSSFSSGQISTIVANKGLKSQLVRVNIENANIGNRFYTYTLIGDTDVSSNPQMPFSRKVIVNGAGPAGVAGGPSNYETLKAVSSVIGNEILIQSPPFSITYLLVDSGSRQLKINDTLTPAIIHWNNPSDIIYGTRLSSNQLNATSDIPGNFIYSPQATALLNAGTGIELKVTFIPNDTVYYPVTKAVKINIKKATPSIIWNRPANIKYGTLLSNTQLNARANMPGIFVYDPPAGTQLDSGSSQVLKTTFTPTDTINYDTISKSVMINVAKATGIADHSEEEMTIYPVPVSDKLMLSNLSAFKDGKLIEVQIISIDGRVMHNLRLMNDENSKSINVSDLPAGLYLLQVVANEKSIIRRFVKQ